MKNTKVLYHASCRDGWLAAWCVHRAMNLDESDLIAVNYGESPERIAHILEIIKDNYVVLVDFTFKRAVMRSLAERAIFVFVIDHHKTAQADLDGLNNEYNNIVIHFDQNRSGAGLAWDIFMSDPRPWVVDYIEDSDLWRNALPNTKEINAYLSSIPFTIQDWNTVFDSAADQAIVAGKSILNIVQQYVTATKVNSRRVTFEGYDVPIINAPKMFLQDILMSSCENEKFAIGWYQRADGKYSFSLRSLNFDVSKLAEKYGGGGHKLAAGFQLPYPIS